LIKQFNAVFILNNSVFFFQKR